MIYSKCSSCFSAFKIQEYRNIFFTIFSAASCHKYWRVFLFLFLFQALPERLVGQDISIDLDGLNIDEVSEGHKSPYVVEFLFSLKNSNGKAIIVPTEQIRLSPFENERPLNSQESGAIILPAYNKLLDTVVISDFSASMTSLGSNADDDQNGISDSLESMEATVSSFFQLMTEDVKSSLVEFHNGLTPPTIVSEMTDSPSILINGLNGIKDTVFNDFSGSTRFWDALDTGLSAMDAGSSGTDEKYLFLFSDGADESSLISPLQVISRAVDNGVKVFTTLYNTGEPLSGDHAPLEFHVDSTSANILPVIKDSNDEIYKSGEARLVITKDALAAIPTGDQFSFFGETGGQVYILDPGEEPTEPIVNFTVSEAGTENLQGGVVVTELVDFSGPGDFWLYANGDNEDAFVYMNTLDGLTESDAIQFAPDHTLEPFWVFSQSGQYELVFNVFSFIPDGTRVETKYKLLVTVDEDVELLDSGAFSAKFTFDGTAWNQALIHDGQEIDPNENIVYVGPEAQRIIADPSEYPFYSGESLFVIDGNAVSLGVDLNEISQGFLLDENVTINLVDYSGDGEMYAWDSDPNNLTFDTSNGLTSVTLLGGSVYPLQWAFTEPGEYSFGFQAVSQTIEPDEPTEGGTINVTVRVDQDLNVLLASATGGEIFTSKTSDQMLNRVEDIIYNLQGRYLARWSTLKRGESPFVPSFRLQLQGQKASYEAPPVVPSLLDGSILEANILWSDGVSPEGGTSLTMKLDYVPRNFQGIRFTYASTHDFDLIPIPLDQGGLLPNDWEIIHTHENGVGAVEVKGPIINGRPSVLPFSSAGKLFQLQFSELLSLGSIFYEFNVTPVNPANSLNFESQLDFLTPRTELIYDTPVDWLNLYGISGDIPALVIAERGDQDNDGVPTWLEYRLGTNPTDENSVFKFFGVSDSEGQPTLSFTTEKFIQYQIESSTDLISWELTQTIDGVGGIYNFVDTLPEGEDHRFYRISVVRPGSISLDIEAEYGTPENSDSWLSIKNYQGNYVTVGVDGKIAFKAADQEEWQFVQSPTTKALWDVDFFNDQWFAVGNAGVVLQSSDGITWKRAETPDVPFLWSIANNGERIVAVGYRGGVISSDDGVSWIETNVSTPDFLRKVIWDGKRFIATGAQGVLLSSADGRRWTSINTQVSNALYDVAYSGSKYVVTGSEGTILVGESINNLSKSSAATSTDLYAVSWLGGRFVIGGENGVLLHSQLAAEWDVQLPVEGVSSPIWAFSPNQEQTFIKAVGSNGSIQNIRFILE